jgi:hypothetical protein
MPLDVNVAAIPAEFQTVMTDFRFDEGVRNKF